MKQLFSFAIIMLLISSQASALYIKYSNKDSKSYKMTVKMDGNTKTVEFKSNTTGAATIQGSGKKCIIETACGKIEVNDNDKIEIKNGCIKIIR